MPKKPKRVKRYTDLPTPYMVKAMEEIRAQTPRGCAVAGGAFLDLLLREIIEMKMSEDAQIKADLFENNGALAGFSARIQMGFALGCYGFCFYKDLMTIRDIRNAFAHDAAAFDFDRPDLVALTSHLWFAKTVSVQARPAPQTSREKFEREIYLLAGELFAGMHPQLKHQAWLHLGPPRPAKQQQPPKKQRGQSPQPNRNPDTPRKRQDAP